MDKFLEKISEHTGIYINTNPLLVRRLLDKISNRFRTFKEMASYFQTDEKNIRNWIKNGKFPLKTLVDFRTDKETESIINLITNKIKFLSVQSSPHKVKIPKITSEIAYLAGYISGDGHLKNPLKSNKWEITIESWKEKKHLKRCKEIVNRHFAISPVISKNKTRKGWRLFINSKIVFLYFSEIFRIPHGKKSSTIRVPEVIKRSSQKIKRAYISGWIDAEGFLTKSHGRPQFEFFIKNNSVSDWVKENIEEMGIKVNKNKKGTLIIYSKNVPIFLSFFSSRVSG